MQRNSRFLTRLAVVAVILGPLACAEVTAPAASCVAQLRFGGKSWADIGPTFRTDAVIGPVVGSVSRMVPCNDTPEPGDVIEDLRDGESNFLEAGTQLHSVEGYTADERLAVFYPLISEWAIFVPDARVTR